MMKRQYPLRKYRPEIGKNQAFRIRPILFRNMIERGPDIVYRFRLTQPTGYDYISPAVTSITGYTPAQFYADPEFGLKILHPQDQDQWRMLLKGENVGELMVTRWFCKDQPVLWMEQHHVIIRDQLGRPIALEGVARNITRRKQAEETLSQTEAALTKFLQSSPLAIAISSLDEESYLFANPVFLDLLGYTQAEIDNGQINDRMVWGGEEQRRQAIEMVRQARSVHDQEMNLYQRDGRRVNVLVSLEIIEFKSQPCVLAMVTDISTRKRMEIALQATNQKLEALIEASPLGIFALDASGNIITWNQSAEQILGWQSQAVLLKPHPFRTPDEENQLADLLETALQGSYFTNFELPYRGPNGKEVFLSLSAAPLQDEAGKTTGVVTLAADVTQRRRAEKIRSAVYQIAQATSMTSNLHELYHSIHTILGTLMPADNFFIALYDTNTGIIQYPYFVDEHDPSPLPMALSRGLTAYVLRTGKPLLASPEVLTELVEKGEVESIGADSIDWLGVPLMANNQIIGALAMQTYTPGIRFGEDEMQVLEFVSSQIGLAIDRKQAEEILRVSEARFRAVVEDQTDLICRYLVDGTLTFVNRALCDYYRLPREELIGHPYFPLMPPEEQDRSRRHLASLTRENPVGSIDHFNLMLDGDIHWTSWTDRALFDDQGQFIEYQSVGRDISEAKQRQREMEAIITVTTALRSARLRAEMIPVILEQLTNLLRTQGSALAVFDTTHNQVSMEAGRGIWQSVSGARTSFGSGTISQVIRSSQPYTNNQAILDPVLAGQNLPPDVVAVACVPLITQELPIGAVCVCRRAAFRDQDLHILTAIADMAANAIHRAMLFEQTQKRLQRLSALRAIDLAISASLDLGMTLNILVEQIIIQLGVNAAILLLYDPYTQMLGYAAGQGFRSQAVKQFRVRLGESHAGKVALERRMEIIRNLNEYNDSMTEGLRSLGESFQLYIAVPLVAKGQIMGVLELFQRTTMEIDPEWLEYLQGMAAQAAIAIDNAELFEKLQRSNAELSMAYDATIEGWSRAMELRDQDVEGHSHRVAELTLDFCRAMGITDLSLEHVRWGVLLHDIGVMAIPDRILKKETPLSEEEWQTMRQHPINAYELLSPIPYLRQAIDIPYCHHERWDGAGYPNRLKGEQIPLAARIFAVVDVWDALSSERPYRQAWPRDAVRDYFQQEAGKQFDPKIVESFLVFESSGFLTQRA